MIPCRFPLSLFLLAVILLPAHGFADDDSTGNTQVPTCLVGLRIIEAKGRTNHTSPNREVAKELLDVKSQLAPLPFLRFQTLSKQEKDIRVGDSGIFNGVGAAQERLQLSVTPEEIVQSRNKVRYLVNWHGERGEKLLATDLKVKNGESMVLVADSATRADESTVLCLNVSCQ